MTIVANLTSSGFVGGPERQMLGLARNLPPDIHSVFLLFGEESSSRPFAEALRREGLALSMLAASRRRPLRLVDELAEALRQSGADVLLCHGYKADLLGVPAARRLKLPVAAVSHGWTSATWKVRIYERVDRIALRQMDRIICVSEAQAQRVHRAGVRRDRITIIRNAIEADAFTVEPDPSAAIELRGLFPPDQEPERIIGAAGRLSPEKGFVQLVEAAALALREDSTLGFVLFGDGPCRPEIERRIAACDLGGRFVLAGFRTDLTRFLPHLDLLAMPSFTEGLPVVALEALAAGVPVVATAVGGTPEVIEDGSCGYLVPPGDPTAMAHRLLEAMADEERRAAMGLRGRDRVAREFTFAAQAEHYRSLLGRLTGAGIEVGWSDGIGDAEVVVP